MGSISDWAELGSLAGAAIGLVGIGVGLWSLIVVLRNVPAARRAAEQARQEARQLTTIVDVASMTSWVDAIATAMYNKNAAAALLRVGDLRLELTRLRFRLESRLTKGRLEKIREFLTNLSSLERDLQSGSVTERQARGAASGLLELRRF